MLVLPLLLTFPATLAFEPAAPSWSLPPPPDTANMTLDELAIYVAGVPEAGPAARQLRSQLDNLDELPAHYATTARILLEGLAAARWHTMAAYANLTRAEAHALARHDPRLPLPPGLDQALGRIDQHQSWLAFQILHERAAMVVAEVVRAHNLESPFQAGAGLARKLGLAAPSAADALPVDVQLAANHLLLAAGAADAGPEEAARLADALARLPTDTVAALDGLALALLALATAPPEQRDAALVRVGLAADVASSGLTVASGLLLSSQLDAYLRAPLRLPDPSTPSPWPFPLLARPGTPRTPAPDLQTALGRAIRAIEPKAARGLAAEVATEIGRLTTPEQHVALARHFAAVARYYDAVAGEATSPPPTGVSPDDVARWAAWARDGSAPEPGSPEALRINRALPWLQAQTESQDATSELLATVLDVAAAFTPPASSSAAAAPCVAPPIVRIPYVALDLCGQDTVWAADEQALLMLDVGGDDQYLHRAGAPFLVTRGQLGASLSPLDPDANTTIGVTSLLDLAGSDTYDSQGAPCSQGAACPDLTVEAPDDAIVSQRRPFSLLLDWDDNGVTRANTFRAGPRSQGYAGGDPRVAPGSTNGGAIVFDGNRNHGVGILVERIGSDAGLSSTYEAGERSQGASIGRETPSATSTNPNQGGYALLLRLIGDRSRSHASFQAGPYSQGVTGPQPSPTGGTDWIVNVGALLNLAGAGSDASDEYQAGDFSQGYAHTEDPHGTTSLLGQALLIDLAKEDSTSSDVYRAGSHSQGYAAPPSEGALPTAKETALFLDAVLPRDTIKAAETTEESASIGPASSPRSEVRSHDTYEGASLGLGYTRASFIDLGGLDRYDINLTERAEGRPDQGNPLLSAGRPRDNASWSRDRCEWFLANLRPLPYCGADYSTLDEDGDGFAQYLERIWDDAASIWEANDTGPGSPSPFEPRIVIDTGTGNLALDRPVALLMSLAGNDRYGPAYHANLHLDASGNDRYEGPIAGARGPIEAPTGARVLAFALDAQGNDRYVAAAGDLQGAGDGNALGILVDAQGSDVYDAGPRSQGYGSNGGIGILVDGGLPAPLGSDANVFRAPQPSGGTSDRRRGSFGGIVATGAHNAMDQGTDLRQERIDADGDGTPETDTTPYGARVTSGVNEAPVILATSGPQGPLVAGRAYTFYVNATDPNGDELDFCFEFEQGSLGVDRPACIRSRGDRSPEFVHRIAYPYTWLNVSTDRKVPGLVDAVPYQARLTVQDGQLLNDTAVYGTFEVANPAPRITSGLLGPREAEVGTGPLPYTVLFEDEADLDGIEIEADWGDGAPESFPGPLTVDWGLGRWGAQIRLPAQVDSSQGPRPVAFNTALGLAGALDDSNLAPNLGSLAQFQYDGATRPAVHFFVDLPGTRAIKEVTLNATINSNSRPFRFSVEAVRPDGTSMQLGVVNVTQRLVADADNACRDGIDNDADGAIDSPADPGCEGANGRNEQATFELKGFRLVVPQGLPQVTSILLRQVVDDAPDGALSVVNIHHIAVQGPGAIHRWTEVEKAPVTLYLRDRFGGRDQVNATVEVGGGLAGPRPATLLAFAGRGAATNLTLVRGTAYSGLLVMNQVVGNRICVDWGDGTSECMQGTFLPGQVLEFPDHTWKPYARSPSTPSLVRDAAACTAGPAQDCAAGLGGSQPDGTLKDVQQEAPQVDLADTTARGSTYAVTLRHYANYQVDPVTGAPRGVPRVMPLLQVHLEEGLDLFYHSEGLSFNLALLLLGDESRKSWHVAPTLSSPYFAVVDAFGDDRYAGHVAVPQTPLEGFNAAGLALVVDVTGDDDYLSTGNFTQGAAYFGGAALLLDAAGDDRYVAQPVSQGAVVKAGIAGLFDLGGDDIFNPVSPDSADVRRGLGTAVGNLLGWIERPPSIEAVRTALAPLAAVPGVSQGSALEGIGMLVASGGYDEFVAADAAQGYADHERAAYGEYAVPRPDCSDNGGLQNPRCFFGINSTWQPCHTFLPNVPRCTGDTDPFNKDFDQFVDASGPRYGPAIALFAHLDGAATYRSETRSQGFAGASARSLFLDPDGASLFQMRERGQGLADGGAQAFLVDGPLTMRIDRAGQGVIPPDDGRNPEPVKQPLSVFIVQSREGLHCDDPDSCGRAEATPDPSDGIINIVSPASVVPRLRVELEWVVPLGNAPTDDPVVPLGIRATPARLGPAGSMEFVLISQPTRPSAFGCTGIPLGPTIRVGHAFVPADDPTIGFLLNLNASLPDGPVHLAGCHMLRAYGRELLNTRPAATDGLLPGSLSQLLTPRAPATPWSMLTGELLLLPPPAVDPAQSGPFLSLGDPIPIEFQTSEPLAGVAQFQSIGLDFEFDPRGANPDPGVLGPLAGWNPKMLNGAQGSSRPYLWMPPSVDGVFDVSMRTFWTDMAGERRKSPSREAFTLVVDRAPPTVSGSAPPAFLGGDAPIELTGHSIDAASGVNLVELRVINLDLSGCSMPSQVLPDACHVRFQAPNAPPVRRFAVDEPGTPASPWSARFSLLEFAGGPVRLEVRAIDMAGRASAWTAVGSSIVDRSAPELVGVITGRADNATNAHHPIAFEVVLADCPRFGDRFAAGCAPGSGTEPESLVAMARRRQSTDPMVPLAVTGSSQEGPLTTFQLVWNGPGSGPEPGAYEILLQARDASGNLLVVGPGQPFDVDRSPPAIDAIQVGLPSPFQAAAKPGDNLSVSVVARDAGDHVTGISRVEAVLGSARVALLAGEEPDTYQGTLQVPSDVPSGPAAVAVEAFDRALNRRIMVGSPFLMRAEPPLVTSSLLEVRAHEVVLRWSVSRPINVSEAYVARGIGVFEERYPGATTAGPTGFTTRFTGLPEETPFRLVVVAVDDAGYTLRLKALPTTLSVLQGTDLALVAPAGVTHSRSVTLQGTVIQPPNGRLTFHVGNASAPAFASLASVRGSENLTFPLTWDSREHTPSLSRAVDVGVWARLDDGASEWSRDWRLRIDNAAPLMTPIVPGEAPRNGWFNRSVIVDPQPVDDTGPVSVLAALDAAPAAPRRTIRVDTDGDHVVLFTARDGAIPPNQATSSLNVRIDATAPVLSLVLPNGTITAEEGAVPIQVGASDATSGVEAYRQALNGAWGPWSAAAPTTLSLAQTAEGPAWLDVESRDRAGSVARRSTSLLIDRTAPLVHSAEIIRTTNGTRLVVLAEDRIGAIGRAAGIAGLRVAAANSTSWSPWMNHTGLGEIVLPSPLQNASRIEFQLRDRAGNTGPRLTAQLGANPKAAPYAGPRPADHEQLLRQIQAGPQVGGPGTTFVFSALVHTGALGAPQRVLLVLGDLSMPMVPHPATLDDGARLYSLSTRLPPTPYDARREFFVAADFNGTMVRSARHPAPLVLAVDPAPEAKGSMGAREPRNSADALGFLAFPLVLAFVILLGPRLGGRRR